jgi:hypothetical protein
MKFYIRPRGGGKTTKVVQWAAKMLWEGNDFLIICPSYQQYHRMVALINQIGGKENNVVCGLAYGSRNVPAVIDNYDMLDQQSQDEFLHHYDVEFVTMTGELL